MRTFTDIVFSAMDHLSEKAGPVASLMDRVVERLAPKAQAQAGVYCVTECLLCTHNNLEAVDYYAATRALCARGDYNYSVVVKPCGPGC